MIIDDIEGIHFVYGESEYSSLEYDIVISPFIGIREFRRGVYLISYPTARRIKIIIQIMRVVFFFAAGCLFDKMAMMGFGEGLRRRGLNTTEQPSWRQKLR